MGRMQVAAEARRLERQGLDARRHALQALQRAGTDLFEKLRAVTPRELHRLDVKVRSGFDELREVEERLTTVSARLERSLETDRSDFASASALGRWLVIARGILERMVLRDRMRADRDARSRLQQHLAALAMADMASEVKPGDPSTPRDIVAESHVPLPESIIAEVNSAREDEARAYAARAVLLEPYAGEPLPPVLRETRRFLHYLWAQLASKVFLRAPAIAGLIAGWWIAHTYTDSAVEGLRYQFGFGGRRAIGAGTMSWLNFIVPLFAAALFSYVAALVAASVQQRYAQRLGAADEVSRSID